MMKVRYFLVAIAVCLMLSVCSGCYGAGYDRSIPARAFPSGDVLEISTGAELNPGLYIAYGANQFSADLSLSALVQKIYRDDAVFQTVSTPSQGSIGALIWVPQGNDTRDVYYLEKVGQGGEKNWYLFSGLCYKLYNDRESTDSILFPGFCLNAPDDDILELSYDTPYLCDPVTVGGQTWEDILQEISAFYESTGYFDVAWQEPILSVRGKGTARNIPALTLRFDTVEEQTYVTILQPD